MQPEHVPVTGEAVPSKNKVKNARSRRRKRERAEAKQRFAQAKANEASKLAAAHDAARAAAQHEADTLRDSNAELIREYNSQRVKTVPGLRIKFSQLADKEKLVAAYMCDSSTKGRVDTGSALAGLVHASGVDRVGVHTISLLCGLTTIQSAGSVVLARAHSSARRRDAFSWTRKAKRRS